MIGRKLMIVGMFLFAMSVIVMRLNCRLKFCSDFIIGSMYGLSIGVLLLSIILKNRGI